MRLTLRTLLAYLDDVLEPAQAREIGEKIGESREAEELVARIREVIRRRRIGTPELAGSGSGPDPNVVADYLENALSPTQVVELEQLCRNSDVHLAEVAACHKVLTMVMSQQINVGEEVRERMYALGVSKTPLPELAAAAAGTSVEPMTDGMGNHQPSRFEEGLPDYLKRRGSKRLWSGVAVLLLAGVWIGLVVSDRSIWSSEDPQPGQQAAAGGVGAGVADEAVEVPVEEAKREQPPEDRPAPVAEVPRARVDVADAVPIDPPPPADRPEQGPGAERPIQERPADRDAPPAVPVAELVDGQPDGIAAPEERRPAAPMGSPLIAAIDSGVLLLRSKGTNAWRPRWQQSTVQVGDEFASPHPFRSELSLEETVNMSLEPGTRLAHLGRTGQTDLRLEFHRGQVVLSRSPDAEQAPVVGILLEGEEWLIELIEPETRVGLDLVPPQPQGIPERNRPLEIGGGIIVASGLIQVRRGEGDPVDVRPDDGWIPWPAAGEEPAPIPAAGIPLWLVPEGVTVTPAGRNLARTYEKEFLPERSVVQSIAPVVSDRRANISELAVRTLSLIGQYKELVPGLSAEHEEARTAAIVGLREWLAQNPGEEERLEEEVSRRFRDAHVESVMRLLWGYSPGDLRQETVSKQLLEWMRDEEIAIRELAFYHVSRFTGRRNNYRASLNAAERRAALAQWEEHLRRTGALIEPQ